MGTHHPDYLSAGKLAGLRKRLASEEDVRGRKKSPQQRHKDREDLAKIRGVKGLDPVKMTARMMGQEGKVLMDTFDFFSDEDYKVFLALGWKVRALGKGHLSDLGNALTTEDRIQVVTRLVRELEALRGQPQIDPGELDRALEVAAAKLEYLKKIQKGQETALFKARYEQVLARQQLADAQRDLAEALEWFDDQDPRIGRLQLVLELAQAKDDASSVLQISQELGQVHVGVMVTDNNFEVIYMNDSILEMFKKAGGAISTQLSNIDDFYTRPARQQRLPTNYKEPYRSELHIAGHVIRFSISP